jgi:CRP/FNR family transcriptional regulator, cyclic AMP receptor protein
MALTRAASKPHAPLEDPLEYLPCSLVAEYRKSQVIYNQNEPSTSIYLILEGRIKVSRRAETGRQVLLNIYQTHEFFGESAFLHLPQRPENATALENTKLMTWTAYELEETVMRQPRLGIAFVQILAQRTPEFTRRIESFSADNAARRLARCLISLSGRMGAPEADGSVSMVPFTHELLSEYIGTTREIVSQYMVQFRNQGYLQFSRKGIVLYRDALREWSRKASHKPGILGPEPTQP